MSHHRSGLTILLFVTMLLTACSPAEAVTTQTISVPQAIETVVPPPTHQATSASQMETVTTEGDSIMREEEPESVIETSVELCASLELTDEECANMGTYDYESSTELTFDSDGSCVPGADRTDSITFEFLGQGRLMQSRNGMDAYDFVHTAEVSTYVSFYPNSPLTWVTEMTFTANGFEEEVQSIGMDNQKVYCIFESRYKRLP